MKQAVILAGGKGTRLQSRLNGLPKPLVDICGAPLLERQIDLLVKHKFDNVLLLVNYGANKIIEYLGSKKNWNIEIDCIDDGEPLGTAGATIAAFQKLQDHFLVVYGDTLLDVDLSRFEKFHKENHKAIATLFLHPNDHPHDSDLVEMGEGEIINAFHPYPHPDGAYLPNLVNAGLYWMLKDALSSFGRSRQFLDFGKDIFPKLIKQGLILRGYNSPEYIKDCGTPERLDKVCSHFRSGRVTQQNLQKLQSAVFLDRDGTINQEVGRISDPKLFELIPGVGDAIKRLNESLYRTIVITNQPVIARGDCTEQDLKKIHNKMEFELGKSGAYLDRIEYCPHHPDKGFFGERAELKIRCACRKPGIGMIKKAEAELNIDQSKSWLIGDSTADILAAKSAGLKSILLQTGHAGLDESHAVLPDFTSPNLYTATNFILHDYPRILSLIERFNIKIALGSFVFIGGLSRSGKSIFANCLKYSLLEKGMSAKVISIDGWLKKDRYKAAENVLERYDIASIKELIHAIHSAELPMKLEIPIYLKKTSSANTVEYIDYVDNKTVFIFEGTIALYLSDITKDIPKSSIYVDVDEESRSSRVIEEYKIRGMSPKEAMKIYQSRQLDEAALIINSRLFAEHFINLNLTEKLK